MPRAAAPSPSFSMPRSRWKRTTSCKRGYEFLGKSGQERLSARRQKSGVVMRAPLLSRGGGAATSRRSSEASFDGADGVVWSENLWITPPRLREHRMLRDFFLIAQPPQIG